MAGRVIGHPVGVVGADILYSQLLDQELGQLIDTRNQFFNLLYQFGFTRQLSDLMIEVPDHSCAGCGWNYDYFRMGIYINETTKQWDRLLMISNILVHLSAAVLFRHNYNN